MCCLSEAGSSDIYPDDTRADGKHTKLHEGTKRTKKEKRLSLHSRRPEFELLWARSQPAQSAGDDGPVRDPHFLRVRRIFVLLRV
jgi:hypothetical protein